jgi:hypothetical protein
MWEVIYFTILGTAATLGVLAGLAITKWRYAPLTFSGLLMASFIVYLFVIDYLFRGDWEKYGNDPDPLVSPGFAFALWSFAAALPLMIALATAWTGAGVVMLARRRRSSTPS